MGYLSPLPDLFHFSSVQSLSHVQLFATPWIRARQASLSPSPGVCSNSCPLSQWCHPTISCFVSPFSSCPQSFPASGSFPMSQLHIRWPKYRASASVSVLLMNILGWFPLGLTGLVSLQSKGLSRVFSKTTVKSINSSALSLLYGPTLNIHTWLLEKP